MKTNLMLFWQQLNELLQHLYVELSTVSALNHGCKVLVFAAQRKRKSIYKVYIYIQRNKKNK